ncbi:MAG: cysteine--tRNA ligase [Actinobacteria bacterium]|nr:cysteine--tRNA ligase [Actinomycetota bacterium]
MRLYNSLTRTREELPPAPGPIRMYVCGSTVYQRIHVGNSRPFVLAMWVKRWLESQGYVVRLVHNITDVDDHVYEEAAKQGIDSRVLADRATAWFFEDTNDLGLGRPDVEPRASETIPEIIALVRELIGRELAYESQGDVYFRVARFGEYGRLSGAQLEDMIAQEPSELKEDQRDFALWKSQKAHEDAAWDSPWGLGRPGWHIECSAMAEKYLGPDFELHGGGNDLRFPHHENELAQSLGAGRPFARVWMHNGMLQLDAEKMSKSLGNVVTLRNVLDVWGREALLLFHLSGHWRQPVDFNDEVMAQAAAQAESLRNAFRSPGAPGREEEFRAFEKALNDDFNTPQALAVLHEWRREQKVGLMRRGLEVFGLASLAVPDTAPSDVQRLAHERQAARDARQFAQADELRDQIEAAGWEVRDATGGFELVPRPG